MNIFLSPKAEEKLFKFQNPLKVVLNLQRKIFTSVSYQNIMLFIIEFTIMKLQFLLKVNI